MNFVRVFSTTDILTQFKQKWDQHIDLPELFESDFEDALLAAFALGHDEGYDIGWAAARDD